MTNTDMTTLDSYLNDVWNKILDLILKSEKFDKIVYDSYFTKTNLVELTDTTAIVTTSERFGAIVLDNETNLFEKLMYEVNICTHIIMFWYIPIQIPLKI